MQSSVSYILCTTCYSIAVIAIITKATKYSIQKVGANLQIQSQSEKVKKMKGWGFAVWDWFCIVTFCKQLSKLGKNFKHTKYMAVASCYLVGLVKYWPDHFFANKTCRQAHCTHVLMSLMSLIHLPTFLLSLPGTPSCIPLFLVLLFLHSSLPGTPLPAFTFCITK